jgi:predicted dehydrogenase
MGMVGGGPNAFIGAIHRIAARMDNQIELVCGAFSSDPDKSRVAGAELFLDEDRCYGSYAEMFAAESNMPVAKRMDFVSIVTPNHLHYPVAVEAIKYGIHVISDKPATLNLEQAIDLKQRIENSECLYALTHTYTGYPMVKEARARIVNGELGKIKKIVVEYSQGWLADTSADSSKQAAWRLDPHRAGMSCCMGDIGVHAANLAEYISGTEISEVCSILETTVDGRVLDDDGIVALRFDNGAKGVLLASQICVGEENNLRIRIYGELASVDWSQQEPNSLKMNFQDKPSKILRAGVGELSADTTNHLRTPAGHPEGYLEAFANIYTDFAEQLRHHMSLSSGSASLHQSPNIDDAIRGMAFIETVVAANKSDIKWHAIPKSKVRPKAQVIRKPDATSKHTAPLEN